MAVKKSFYHPENKAPLPDESDLIEIMEIVTNRIKEIKWLITADMVKQ